MLEGMLYTLWVAIPSIALSTIFGLLLAILSIAPTRLVRAPTCSTSSVTWSDARCVPSGAVRLVQAPPNRPAWRSHPALTGWRGAI